MTVFGDLDVSTLTELPAGRSPITSHVVPAGEKPHFLERAWQRVREEVDAGHQAYVVCPRIGGDRGRRPRRRPPAASPPTPTRRRPRCGRRVAVLDVAPMLADGPLAGLRIEVLHGRLPPEAKDDVMRRFAAGEVDVLVATTVVEVGVDVAERHGHGGPRRRPVRRLAAAPAARPGRPRVRARAVPARHRRRGRQPRPRAARRRGRDPRRLRAVPARPRDPPRGRRARRHASPAGGPACGCSRCCATSR